MYLGAYNILTSNGEQDRQVFNTTVSVIHKNYDSTTLDNDIAVLKLTRVANGTGEELIKGAQSVSAPL